MARYKTFDATGIATAGKIYAGDLNGMQDAAAKAADFAQTVDVGTLRVGDSSIGLAKYGTGEASLSSALRVSGLLRGLQGIITGTFSTAARNAIGAGLAPLATAIYNTDTSRWEYNAGSDGARDWRGMGGATSGIFSALPSPGQAGRQYWDTTNKVMWVDTGTRWLTMDGQIGFMAYYTGPVATLTGVVEVKPGWLLLNGSLFTKVTYADLYAAWGANCYGTDTTNEFRSPSALGKVVVPRDGTQTEFDTMADTGGEKAHVLTTAELPVHTPSITPSINTGTAPNANGSPGNNLQGSSAGGTAVPVASIGSGTAHNNLQPYFVTGAAIVKY